MGTVSAGFVADGSFGLAFGEVVLGDFALEAVAVLGFLGTVAAALAAGASFGFIETADAVLATEVGFGFVGTGGAGLVVGTGCAGVGCAGATGAGIRTFVGGTLTAKNGDGFVAMVC